MINKANSPENGHSSIVMHSEQAPVKILQQNIVILLLAFPLACYSVILTNIVCCYETCFVNVLCLKINHYSWMLF